jgi:hydroxymethylpyrimidine pyrophosphatase-like HAD family hydrolase
MALATDGDGTLMRGGYLARSTIAALKQWRRAGKKLLLVTGETPKELCDFKHLELFDRLIAENGAVLMDCRRKHERKLAKPAPPRLIRALKEAGIKSLKRGRLIFQAELDAEDQIARILKQQRTRWKLVRNRDELMIVPPGVTKATGLVTALKDMGIAPQQVAAIGDAENDAPLLAACGLGVAVQNAVPPLKKKSQVVLKGSYGKGVVELVDWLLNAKRRAKRRRRLNRANRNPRQCNAR